MNPFYVSIIFLGIMLIVFSFVWILYDKKKGFDYQKKIDEKKKELIDIIEDAEQMVEELNKFSDYVITQMDIKNEELNKNLKKFEDKVDSINNKAIKEVEKKVEKKAYPKKSLNKVVNGSELDIQVKAEVPLLKYNNEKAIDKIDSESTNSPVKKNSKTQNSKKDKVIPLKSSKHKEVMQLAEEGFSETEIARKLNVGKGEIQLILGLYKK